MDRGNNDKYGTGGWDAKARSFSTTRSVASLQHRYRLLQSKAEEEGVADMTDVRVAMWNTETQRVVSGNAAPRRCRVSRYLREHPEYEILDGQDEEIVSSAGKISKPLAVHDKDVAPDFWTIREDVELAELIDQYGRGDWESKAQSFSTARSARDDPGRSGYLRRTLRTL